MRGPLMPTISLGQLVKLDIREVWKSEAQDFTPWLAEEVNIALLGDAIGLELEVEAKEKEVGPFRADILCKDTATGKWVLIENQLERTDHCHLGQLITYAAGLKAVNIIWIASRFTDEHRAAIDWLNEITDGDFNFFALEVEIWKIGDSAAAPKFNIVCAPNNWTQTVTQAKKVVEGEKLSNTQLMQLEFWTGFREFALDRAGIIKPTKPLPQVWMGIAIGKTGFGLLAVASTWDSDLGTSDNHQLRVELCLIDDPTKENFHQLEVMKSAIEGEYGGPLVWLESPNKKQSKICVKRAANLNSRDQWTSYFDWLLTNLEKFHAVFAKRLKNLNLSAPTEVAP